MINQILNTDSYKLSHFLQYPPNTEQVSCYVESRGGRFNRTLFFGLQIFLKEYMTKFITKEDIELANLFSSEHGEPFNMKGFLELQELGYWPVQIQAIPEGTIIQTNNVLVQITNTDPRFYWLPSFLETMLLRGVWYPTTVCTLSWMCKQLIKDFMLKTSDNPDDINFKLHDFGARGASSLETASIGGCSHLVNFMGTDTMVGILAAQKYYNAKMVGFSIPAAEHSTITSWGGVEGELDSYKNMLNQFAKPGKIVAVVSDSYDIFKAIKELWGGHLKNKIIDSKATIVIRPDSGNPVTVVRDVIKELMNVFGYETNTKNYDVLPPYIRVIQGDGIEYDSIFDILTEMTNCKLSTDNISFGMGGALLQNLDRDFLKFAMKTSAIKINGNWIDVYKDPITDTTKRSKKGRLALCKNNINQFITIRENEAIAFGAENLLKDVYLNGKILREFEFEEVRKNASGN
jgi:nicotinamide phosphoribosyltransferase